ARTGFPAPRAEGNPLTPPLSADLKSADLSFRSPLSYILLPSSSLIELGFLPTSYSSLSPTPPFSRSFSPPPLFVSTLYMF
ncbi:hypothetical protein NPIL_678391, partial [Nephila pilipes]